MKLPKLPKLTEAFSSRMEGLTPRQLIMLSGAAGILTFLFLFIALSGSPEVPEADTKPATEIPMKKVVKVKSDIPARTELRESMLQVVDIPQDLAPEDAAADTSRLLGRPTRVAMLAGDIVTSKKIYGSVKEAGFTGMIPADCRAVTIEVNEVTGVAGFAKPGDYVDIMLVSSTIDTTKITGEIIMQNVMLLGINRNNSKAEDEPKSDGGDTDKKDDKAQKASAAGEVPANATLAVHPEDVLRLAVAAQAGKFYLALRPFKAENKYTLDTEYEIAIRKRAETPAPAPAPAYIPRPAPAPAPAPATPSTAPAQAGIEVIRGTTASR